MVFNYSKGKIYKLTHPDTEKIYIGSTICGLSKRLCQHKWDYNKYLIGEHNYVSSFDLFDLGVDDSQIQLIELFPCNSKKELLQREGYWIKKYDEACVNKYIPCGLDRKEYRKEYSERNQETKKQQNKEYREQNQEKIKEQKKEYYKQNEEQLKHKQKQYYQENFEKIKEYRKQTKLCEVCNCQITKSHFSRHLEAKKHINNLNKQQ